MFWGQLIWGAWLSNTVMEKEQVEERPDASNARHAILVVPTKKEEPLIGPPVRTTVVLEQLSVAVGIWYVAMTEQAPCSQFKTWLDGHSVKVGACPSLTMIRKEQVRVLLEASVAIQVTTVVPLGKVLPLAPPLRWQRAEPGQLSE